MTDNVNKNSRREKRKKKKKLTTKFPYYVNATIFEITNASKSSLGQSHVTAGGQ